MGVCFLVFIAVGVGEARDAAVAEPALWGTFAEQDCEPKLRGGCSSIGTWTSDDGGVVKTVCASTERSATMARFGRSSSRAGGAAMRSATSFMRRNGPRQGCGFHGSALLVWQR